MILGAENYTVTRKAAGAWSNGVFVPGSASTFTVRGSVQPLDAEVLQQLKDEAARSQATWILLCDSYQASLAVSQAGEDTTSDRVDIDGQEHMVLAVMDWHRHRRGVPYRSYVLGEVSA